MRILHLSDIHFACPSKNPLQIFSKRFIGNLNYLLNRKAYQSHQILDELIEQLDDFDPDVVLISGDFTTTGDKKEYQRAKELIFRIGSRKVFGIPGNHDAYTRLTRHRNPFYHHLGSLLPNVGDFGFSLSQERVATFQLDEKLRLLLLDCSMYSSLIHSNGHFTPQIEKNLLALLNKIPKDETILFCCHYPFFGHEAPHRRLIRFENLKAIIQAQPNIHYYLHGHTHRHALADLRKNGLPFILDSGSIAEKKRATFNLIDIENHKIDVNVYLYQSGWKKWRGIATD